MKKLGLGVLSLFIIINLTGCVQNTPKVPVKVEVMKLKTSTDIIQAEKISIVENGKLILANGDVIYDEEGDIKAVYNLNNKDFYLLQKNDKTVSQIKDVTTKKIIKEFKASTVQWFNDGKNVIFAVKFINNRTNVYNNIYSFNGTSFNLVNKNVIIPFGAKSSGAYAIKPYFTRVKGSSWGYSFNGYGIINVKKGNQINLIPKYAGLTLFGKKSNSKYILGSINNNIFYLYKNINGKYTLEVYNDNTKMQETILITDKKLQFLKYNDQIVIKIFNNKNLKTERLLGSQAIKIQTKYANEPATYLSLNSLKIVKGVSKEFKPIIVNGNFAMTLESYITYSLDDLENALYHYKESGTLREIFKDYHGSQAYNGRVF